MATVANDRTTAPAYLHRIVQLRYFWGSLVRNDLRARYRNSFLGIAWSLARPLGMTAVLTVVFTKIVNVEASILVPHLAIGITVWQFLVESMVTGCNAFKIGSAYIRQQPVPLAIFPLRTVLGTGIHAAFAMLVALALLCLFRGPPSLTALATVMPGLVIVFLLALALATLLGIIHTHFPDTQHLLEIALQALFYLTPVMYTFDVIKNRGHLIWIIYANPFTWVLEVVRGPLVGSEYPSPFLAENAVLWPETPLILAGSFLLLVGGLAWYALRRFERDLVYWI
jgi:lipopolysaccharide transport system permease protein